MSTDSSKAKQLIAHYSNGRSFSDVLKDVSIKDPGSLPQTTSYPGVTSWTEEARLQRIAFIKALFPFSIDHLSGKKAMPPADQFRGNIENMVGFTQVPTGLMGPLMINGTVAQGDFYVPMATTEGALVASYNRGAKATRLSGGITAICTTEGLQRSPVWKFETLVQVGEFIHWVLQQIDHFKKIVLSTSRYAKLESLKINMEGNHVLTIFEYTCGEAAGQNMVTICTDAVCQYIVAQAPVKPLHWFIESNYSGDKKATAVAFTTVRGKKVTAEAIIKRKIVEEVLNSTPEAIAVYWQTSVVAASQSNSIGIQGHFANGLTAVFLACGQDVACISEAHVGITRMEVHPTGDLYVAITLPALVVGTVGGGTSLPTQQECLQILGCTGEGSARKFAEICGAVALAGELSIAAALASGQFSKAHRIFGRKKQ
jgi:hydroxymethylglutaryl-CoA reductase (NADPH)